MPEWFQNAFHAGEQLPEFSTLLSRISLAVLCGLFVAGIYAVTLGRQRQDSRTLPTTLVLLCVLIAVVTLVIGNSVARAFGLVGALSIVRFRTVVEDTRDTAFVIFAVAVGMAVGAGHVILAAIAIPTVAGSSLLMCQIDRPAVVALLPNVALSIRVVLGFDPKQTLLPCLEKYLVSIQLTSIATAKQGAALELNYSARLQHVSDTMSLVAELNRIEGVQAVELRQTS